MNAPVLLAQLAGSPAQTIASPKNLKIEKPQNGQAVTVQLDGATKLDLAGIASERLTFVRVGEKLVILFDNQSTVTVDPVFDNNGRPVTDLAFDMGADRTLSSEQFAQAFPITTDQSVLPAAGGATGPTGGASFADASVGALAGSGARLGLLAGEDGGGSFATDTETQANATPIPGGVASVVLNEDGFAEGNLGGSGDDGGTATSVTGSLNVNFGTDSVGRRFAFDAGQPDLQGLTSGGQAISLSIVNEGGVPRLVGYVGTDPTIAGNQVFIITLNVSDAGDTYTFQLLRPLDHSQPGTNEETLNLTISVTAFDGSSDRASVTIQIGINDDTPTIGDPAGVTVIDPLDSASLAQSGSLGISWGSDRFNNAVDGGVSGSTGGNGDRSVVFTSAVVGVSGASANAESVVGSLTSNGETVRYVVLANGTTLVAYTGDTVPSLPGSEVGSNIVFIVTLSDASDTGSYTITQYQPLDHVSGGQNFSTIDLSFQFTARDSDGDPVSGGFTVRVNDTAPTTGEAVAAQNIGEDGLPGASMSEGSYDAVDNASLSNIGLNINWGADNDTRGNGASDVYGRTLSFLSGGETQNPLGAGGASSLALVITGENGAVLTSGGVELQYVVTVNANGGETLTAHKGAPDDSNAVFTVTLDPTAPNGAYSFTLIGQLDHASNSNSIGLTFTVQAADADGDTVNASFTVNVQDDTPVAHEVTAATILDDEAQILFPGNNTPADGAPNANVVQGSAGTLFTAGADGVKSITISGGIFQVVYKDTNGFAQTESVTWGAGVTDVNGNTTFTATSEHYTGSESSSAAATLVINVDGSYTYTAYAPVVQSTETSGANPTEENTTINIGFVVTDGDGDPATGSLSVNVNDDIPVAHNVTAARLDDEAQTLFTPTNSGGLGDVSPNINSVMGGPGSLLTAGSDGVKSVVLSTAPSFDVIYKDTLGFAQKESVTWGAGVIDANGNTTFKATSAHYTGENNAGVAAILVVGADGSYSLTLFAPIVHDIKLPGIEENKNLSFGVTVTDGDGDQATATLRVSVNDDTPAPIASIVVGAHLLDDEAQSLFPGNDTPDDGVANNKVVTGAAGALFSMGADGLGSLSVALPTFSVVYAEDGFAKTESVNWSAGVRSADGTTTFTATSTHYSGSDGSGVAATLVIKADGSYSFSLGAPVVQSGNGEDSKVLTFLYTVTDGDGDPAGGSLFVTVNDDVPVAKVVTAAAVLDDEKQSVFPGNANGTGDVADANVASGGVGALFGAGADGVRSVTISANQSFMVVYKDDNGFAQTETATWSKTGTDASGHTTFTASSSHYSNAATLVIGADGSYTFTVNAPVVQGTATSGANPIEENATITVNFIVTDGDGDTASGSLSVNVNDDTPVAHSVTTAKLDDEAQTLFTPANNGGLGDVSPNINSVTGAAGSLFTAGSDGVRSVTLAGPAFNVIYKDTQGFAQIEGVNWSAGVKGTDGTTNFTATGATSNLTVATLIVGADGSYKLTVSAPVAHDIQLPGIEENKTLTFGITVTDGDGDQATATLRVDVDDDTPVPVASIVFGSQIMDDEAQTLFTPVNNGGIGDVSPNVGSVSGGAGTLFNMGADGLGSLSVGLPSFNAIYKDGGFAKVESVDWSNGERGLNGVTTFTATGHESGNTVAVLVIKADGSYSFTLSEPVAHDFQLTGIEDTKTLTFTYTAKDGDGDAAVGSLSVSVNDDTPTAKVLTASTVLDDEAQTIFTPVNTGGTNDVPFDTNTVHGDAGTLFSAGADGLRGVMISGGTFDVVYKDGGFAKTESVTWSAGVKEADGTTIFTASSGHYANAAKLVIGADGSYTFTVNAPVVQATAGTSEENKTIKINFAVTDGDGDTASGSLSVNVNDDTPVAYNITSATVLDDEAQIVFPANAYGTGDVPNANAATGAAGTLFTAGADGVRGVTISGGAFEVVYKDDGFAKTESITWGAGVKGTDGSTTFTAFSNHYTTAATLVIGANGSYTFTVFAPVVQPTAGTTEENKTIKINFVVTDGDGDTAAGSLSVDVNDDTPVAKVVTASRVLDDEAQGLFTPTNSGGLGDVSANFNSVTGAQGSLFTAGSDGVRSVTLAGPVFNVNYKDGQGFAQIEAVTWETGVKGTDGTTTFIATGATSNQTAATLVVGADGSYKLTLSAPVAHDIQLPGVEENKTLAFGFTVTDGDGDQATATLRVDVNDDTPVPVASIVFASQIMDDEIQTLFTPVNNGGIGDVSPNVGTVSGGAGTLFNMGADGLGSLSVGLPSFNAIYKDGGFAKVEGVDWSNGVRSADGITTFTAKGHESGNTVAVLVMKADGSYRFALSEPVAHDFQVPAVEDTKTLTFTYTATDGDGDGLIGSLSVSVNDDTPTAKVITASTVLDDEAQSIFTPVNAGGTNDVADTNTVSGSAGALFSAGADGLRGVTISGGAFDVVYKDGGFAKTESVTWSAGVKGTDGSTTFTASSGHYTTAATLVIGADGSYTYTTYAPVVQAAAGTTEENKTIKINFTVIDGDGDTASGSLSVNVNDDTPLAHDVVSATKLDDEAQTVFTPTNNGGLGDVSPNVNSVTGAAGSLFTAGADGVKSVALAGPAFNVIYKDGQGFAQIEAISWDNGVKGNDGITTFTATSAHHTGMNGNGVAATLVVGADGSYKLTLLAPVAHDFQLPTIEESKTLSFGVTVTDGDGDQATATLRVDVNDDTPVPVASIVLGSRIMDDEAQTLFTPVNNGGFGDVSPNVGSVSGGAGTLFNMGADGLGSLSVALPSFNAIYNVGGFAKIEGIDWSNGVRGEDGATTFTATGLKSGHEVAELVIKADGSYSFTLSQPVAHDFQIPGVEDTKTLTFTYTAKDGDGDAAVGSLSVSVNDDTPTAKVVTASTVLDDEAQSIFTPVNAGGTNDVDDTHTVSGIAGTLFSAGADGMRSVTISGGAFDVVYKDGGFAKTESVTWGAGATDANGNTTFTATSGHYATAATLVIGADGSYTLTVFAPVVQPTATWGANPTEENKTIKINFTVTDGDGDTASGSLSVNVNDDTPVITAGPVPGANLIDNGQFLDNDGFGVPMGWGGDAATGSIKGWIITGAPLERNPSDWYVTDPVNGGRVVDLDASPGNVTLIQTLNNLTAGASYTLSFDAAKPGTFSAQAEVWWNGVRVGVVDPTNSFQQFSYTFIAIAGANKLEFREVGQADNGGTFLANVQLHASSSFVDDDAQSGGNAGGISDVANGNSASGTAGALFSIGADGLKSAALNATTPFKAIYKDVSGIPHQESVTWGQPVVAGGATTWTATGDTSHGTVATLTINADGSYTFTVLKPLVHPTSSTSEDNLSLTFNYTVTDGDGDTASGSLNVQVNDDTPTIPENAIQRAGVDDDALAGGNPEAGDTNTASGVLSHSFGADGGTLAWTTPTLPTGGYTFNVNGTTMEVFQSQDGLPVKVFTVSLDPVTGAYTVTQLAAINHPSGNGEQGEGFNLNYRVTDSDGDYVESYLRVVVGDDVPVSASVVNATTILDDDALAGGNAGGTGDVADATMASGGAGALFSIGADGLKSVALNATTAFKAIYMDGGVAHQESVSWGPPTVVGGATTWTATGDISHGNVATLTINADGSYSFTMLKPLVHPTSGTSEESLSLNFNYTVTDGDKDTATGSLTVQVNDDTPIAPQAYRYNEIYESDLANGPASGAYNYTIKFGADGYGATAFTGAVKLDIGPGLAGNESLDLTSGAHRSTKFTSDGRAITFKLEADGIIRGYVTDADNNGGGEVPILQLKLTGTNVTTTLYGSLDHIAAQDGSPIASLVVDATVRFTDGDGDSVTSIIRNTFHDGSPSAGDQAATAATAATTAYEDGTRIFNAALNINWGADDANPTSGASAHDRSIAFLSTAVTLAGSSAVSGLTSYGDTVRLAYLDTAHTILIGYTGNAAPTDLNATNLIFVVTLNDAGNYNFDLRGPIDHPAPNGQNQQFVDIGFAYQVTDSDGDTDPGTFTVRIDAAGTIGSIHYDTLTTGVFVNLADTATTLNGQTVAANTATDLSGGGGRVVGNDAMGAISEAHGSKANDILVGGDEDNTLYGNDGDDTVSGGLGADRLYGGAGNDTFLLGKDVTGSGTRTFVRGDGSTVEVNIDGLAGTMDPVVGGSGYDKIVLDRGSASGYVYDANRAPSYISGIEEIVGTDGNDVIMVSPSYLSDASNGGIKIDGGDGNDHIGGGAGNDTLVGGEGNDTISGLGGNDTIRGGAGNDSVWGGDGDDIIFGEDGNDALRGDAGNDTIDGGAGNDQISGGSGDNVLIGGTGDDLFFVGGGNDMIYGNAADTSDPSNVLAKAGEADTVVYYGNQADFQISLNADGSWTVAEPGGTTDKLFGIEGINFNGGPVELNLLANVRLFDGDPADGGHLIGTFDTIQAALNAAAATGHYITLAAGTYNENVTVDKGVTILGAQHDVSGDAAGRGTGESVINGQWSITTTHAVTIDGLYFNNVSSSGTTDATLSIMTGGDHDGHVVENSVFYSAIAGGDLARQDRAIFVSNAATTGHITIDDNLITGNAGKYGTAGWGRGVWVDGGGADLTISDNTFKNVRSGLNLDQNAVGSPARVHGNTFIDSGTAISLGDKWAGDITDDFAYNVFQNVDLEINLQNLNQGVTLDLSGTFATVTDNTNDGPVNDAFYVLGTQQRDIITGSANGDALFGNGGTDTLYGGAGDDLIDGGAGSDEISGGKGNDAIYGGVGGDTIKYTLDDGTDTIDGGDGSDVVILTGSDAVESTVIKVKANGFDVDLDGDGIFDVLTTNVESVIVDQAGATDKLTLIARDTADTIKLEGNANLFSIYGSGVPAVYGIASEAVVIEGKGGDDVIDAHLLNVSGPQIALKIDGGDGSDTITGSAGKDTILGGNGVDTIHGGAGDDDINGGSGDDKLFGDAGKDLIRGSDGNDEIHGGDDNDELHGEGGNDTIYGDAGNDTVYGGIGNDTIYGGDGNDQLYGQDGDDTIEGGLGNDQLGGGSGNDAFLYKLGDGADVIDGGADTDTLKYGHAGLVVHNIYVKASGENVVITPNDGVNGTTDVEVAVTAKNVEKLDIQLGDYEWAVIGQGGGNFSTTALTSIDVQGTDQSNSLWTSNLGSATAVTADLKGGDDLFVGGGAAMGVNVDGGSGVDTVDYSQITQTVTIDLETGSAQRFALNNTSVATDTITHFENVNGTIFNDTISGSSVANVLDGNAGNDRLVGLGGDDRLIGGEGDDTLYGNGYATNPSGADLNATAGEHDTAVYRGLVSDFAISRNADGSYTVTDTNTADGDEGTDTLFGIEGIDFGANNTVDIDLTDAVQLYDANGHLVATFDKIQDAVNAADGVAGAVTILVAAGVYQENVVINRANVSLLSMGGKGVTTIEGVAGAGQLGTIQLAPGADHVTIGGIGHGFTIIGFDGTPAIETAAVYLQGTHSDLKISGNEIVANGDAGLLSEFGYAVTDVVIDHNEFSGQTFTGTAPAGLGSASQFSLLNVPRQLVTISNGSNVHFTDNDVTGTAGGMSVTDNSGNPIAATSQGNSLVTIDTLNSLIQNNNITGYTTFGGYGIRVRGAGTSVIDNTLDDTSGGNSAGIFVNNQGTPGTYSGNVFLGGTANEIVVMTPGVDTFHGGAGNDLFAHVVGSGSDIVDGGSETGTSNPDYDILNVIGDATARTFNISKATGGADIVPLTGTNASDVEVSYTGSGAATIRADEIERVTVTLGSGGDTVSIGDISGTAIAPSTIVIQGGAGADTLKLADFIGDTRVVFNGNGGTDKIDFGAINWKDAVVTSDGNGGYTIEVGGHVISASAVESFQFADGAVTAPQLIEVAPTDITTAGLSVAENSANGTVVGSIFGVDGNGAIDALAYGFVVNGQVSQVSADGRFAINALTGQITVANGTLLDYETATSHNETVRVTDSHGKFYNETVTISVTDVVENHAPTFGAGTSTGLVTEDASTSVPVVDLIKNGGVDEGNVVGQGWNTTSTVYFVNAGGSHGSAVLFNQTTDNPATLTLTQSVTTVVGQTYVLTFALEGLYAQQGTYPYPIPVFNVNATGGNTSTITFVNDQAFHTYTYQFTASATSTVVTFSAVPFAYGGIYIDDVSLTATVGSGTPGVETVAGAISFTDLDASDTHTVTYAIPAGSSYYGTFDATVDNVADKVNWTFSVNDSAIQSLGANDHINQIYTLTLSDGHGGSVTKDVTVTVNGVNDKANISGTVDGAVKEDGALTVGGTVTVTDVDSGEAKFQAPSSLAGTYGMFTFDTSTGVWGYTLNNSAANVQALGTGDVKHDTLTVSSIDGTASQTIEVTINGTDEPAPLTVKDVASANGRYALSDDSEAINAIGLDASTLFAGGMGAVTYSYSEVYSSTNNFGWISRNGNVFSGNPATTDAGLYVYKVTATDSMSSISTYVAFESLPDGALNLTINSTSNKANVTGSAPWLMNFSNGYSDAITATVDNSLEANAGSGFDVMIGSGGANNFNGGADDDSIYGLGGNDTLLGGAGVDHIDGGAGNDVITGGTGNDVLLGGSGNDTFKYVIGDGADIVDGGVGNDTLAITGTNGSDTLTVVVSGGAIAQFNGGTITGVETVSLDLGTNSGGIGDTLSYAGTTEAVTVNLAAGTATGFSAISNVENVTGGTGNDVFKVTSSQFAAGRYIDGGLGADTIQITNTASVVDAAFAHVSGIETLQFGAFANSVTLGSNATTDIGNGTLTVDGTASTQLLFTGTNVGSSAHLNVLGGANTDVLIGGAGDDILVGGKGADQLTGGGGSDIFRYLAGDANTLDTILDFQTGSSGDVLDLSGLLASVSGNKADHVRFSYAGGATHLASDDATAPPAIDGTVTLQVELTSGTWTSVANIADTGSNLSAGSEVIKMMLDSSGSHNYHV